MSARTLLVAGWTLLTIASVGESQDAFREQDSLFEWRLDSDWESPAEERDRLVTDRPHVSEATALVGLGRVQLETGYTFFADGTDGVRTRVHSFPEPLLRVGMFAEWFELRLGGNYLVDSERTGASSIRRSGVDDMLLASKIALAKQVAFLPDLTIFPQFRLPTGSRAFNAERVLPGMNIAYSWALTPILELECNTVFNQRRDGVEHVFWETLQTANFEWDLGDRWLAFTEYLAFLPSSSRTELPEHYFHYGLQWFPTPNFQIDVHHGVGLNRSADALAFTGVGLSWRR